METSTLIRVIVFMVVAVIVITWLDNKNIAARSQQHFANRAPAEHTMFVLCPVVTHTSEQVADAVKSIVRLVKEARWPEALSIGIVDLADKHLPHHDLDARVAAQCRVLGIPDVHVRYTRLRLPSDKQLRRNRTLHNVSTLEYARKAGVQRLYNREDYVLLYDPLHVAMESWWDSTLIDTRKRAIKEGHQRPIVSCVPQFEGIYAFDNSPEHIARISKGVDPLIPIQSTMWVCPWLVFADSRFVTEELPVDVAQPDDMQVTALLWSRNLAKHSWTAVLPLTKVATGHLVCNGPFDQQRLQRLHKVELCCTQCGHPRITHGSSHPFKPP
jgi:hypothetical protein